MEMRLAQGVVCVLFFCSGASGLVLQVVWARRLALVFGTTVQAAATVSGAFLLGLGLGAWLVGRTLSGAARLLGWFGILELVVGVSGLAVTVSIPHVTPVAVWLAGGIPGPYVAALRFAAIFALLITPCTAMGATLPVLTHFLTRRYPNRFGMILGLLYAINTLGGAVGVLATDFLLVANLGVVEAASLASAFDCAVGITALLLARSTLPVERDCDEPPGKPAALPWTVLCPLIASGFCGLALEIIWTRMMVFFNGADIYAYALVLGTYLLGLVVGSLIFSRSGDLAHPEAWTAILFGLLAWASLLSLPAAGLARSLSASPAAYAGPLQEAQRLMIDALVILPATVVLGAMFPLLSSLLFRFLGQAGASVGRAYLWNTLGSLCGALGAGFVIIPRLGLQGSLHLVCGAAAVTSLLCLAAVRSGRVRIAVAGGTVLLGAALLLIPSTLLVSVLQGKDYQNLLYHGEDAAGAVALVRQWNGWEVDFNDNLKTDGTLMMANDIRSKRYATLLAVAPAMLHDSPRHVLVICLGLANTLTAAVNMKQTDQVTCVELCPKVAEAIRMLPYAAATLQSTKVTLHYDDGRNFLLSRSQQFDIITAEPPPPHNAGSINLYSREYFELCRSRLKPGGLLSHWLPIGQLSSFESRGILRAFQEVFPHTYLWEGADYHLCLLGSLVPLKLDSSRLRARFASNREWLRPVGLEDPDFFLATCLRGPDEIRRYVSGVSPLTDNHPYVQNFRGGEPSDVNFFFGGSGPEQILGTVPTPATREGRAALRDLRHMLFGSSHDPYRDRLIQNELAREVTRRVPDNAYLLASTRSSDRHLAWFSHRSVQRSRNGEDLYEVARIHYVRGRDMEALAWLQRSRRALQAQGAEQKVLDFVGQFEQKIRAGRGTSPPSTAAARP